MQMMRDLEFALNQSETFLQIPDPAIELLRYVHGLLFQYRYDLRQFHMPFVCVQAINAAIEQTDQGLCNLASVTCGLQADLLSFVTTKYRSRPLLDLSSTHKCCSGSE